MVMARLGNKDQREWAAWAVACARRVLPYFEGARPGDGRPRAALVTLQKWRRTGVFSMKEIRSASLAAHAAAREVLDDDEKAGYAARAAGQAVGTAHVTEHAFGAAYYALKLTAVAHPSRQGMAVRRELAWQTRHLPERLRPAWQKWQKDRLPKGMKAMTNESSKTQ